MSSITYAFCVSNTFILKRRPTLPPLVELPERVEQACGGGMLPPQAAPPRAPRDAKPLLVEDILLDGGRPLLPPSSPLIIAPTLPAQAPAVPTPRVVTAVAPAMPISAKATAAGATTAATSAAS
eukprot:CAMPEP_0175752714 /NCGR_PEP_ID=MMETSP0097-20121207/61915_1 /TAXON_ID=311494 /ORGANISM="Alexandrium monilatum, Strain CCMP3105" /LENGTH=123 /DNA_ID=CAMNT_0017061523 /DNA_START=1 /DNA_END=369 /DNA_ORIENTATION=-